MKIRMIGLPVLAVIATLVVAGCGQKEMSETMLHEVDSTTFSHVGYDAAAEKLTVVFRDGGETYVYKGISADMYRGLLAADSLGTYYHANIRDKFEHDKK